MKFDLDLIIRALKLPPYDKEYRFHQVRKWRFDYCWTKERVAMEYEGGSWTGGAHVRGTHFSSDCEKYSTAAIMGWKVIRVTADMVRNGKAAELLEMAFKEGKK